MKITEFVPEQKNYTKKIKEIFDENFKEKIYLLKRIQDEDNHKVLLNIFEIVSDSLEVNESLLKFIDKKTPVHNLFVFRTNEKEEFQYKILLAYKEIYKDDDNKSLVKNIGKYFSTNWISKERYIEYTTDICMENIFEELFFKISKYKKIEGESLKSIIEINDRIISLKSEIKKLNVKLGNEKQVNKRSEIHHKIQVYKQKLDEIERIH